MTSPSSVTGAGIHQSWFPGSRRHHSTPPSDWKHRSLCYRATTLTSGRKKTHAHKHTAAERSPTEAPQVIEPLPSQGSDQPCILSSRLPFFFSYSLALKDTQGHLSARCHITHVCLRCSDVIGKVRVVCSRDGSNFISKNSGLALRPVPAWRRELAWQHGGRNEPFWLIRFERALSSLPGQNKQTNKN